MTAHPWLSKVVFCCGFIVGYGLCFMAISLFREIHSTQWRQYLVTLYSAPTADSDPTPPATGPNTAPHYPPGRLCWVVTTQKKLYSRGIHVCTERYLRQADRLHKAHNDTSVVVEKLRPTLSQLRRLRTYVRQGYVTGGVGYVLSREMTRITHRTHILVLRNGSSVKEVQMACCLTRDARNQWEPMTFQML